MPLLNYVGTTTEKLSVGLSNKCLHIFHAYRLSVAYAYFLSHETLYIYALRKMKILCDY
jgi:hypothetical protein